MKLNYQLSIITIVVLCLGHYATVAQQSIVGTWQNNDMGFQMTLMLNSNGTGEFDGEAITYSVQGNTLRVVEQGYTSAYTFILKGDALTLSGGDLDQSITFTRSGSSAPLPSTSGHTPTSTALLGAWSNYGETIEFKDNGQCLYLGQTFRYEVSGNTIVLQTAQGDITMNYAVQGNQLSLNVNGKALTYTKGNAKTTTSPAGTGSKQVAAELVGKWCYTNLTTTNTGGVSNDECIVLNADGTYQYSMERSMDTNTNAFWAGTNTQGADSGTWSYDGNRIYYNSPTRGSGSFGLQKQNHPKNGDPMIVLDGKAYVTFYQKSPW